ncbi:hypothetical protein BJV82DRAFT_392252 [Fennellomyces sp. T-0311]|nr:hypothetical protein BJV82DRAFT_392252 [Fennellomyces sp. T-0311]
MAIDDTITNATVSEMTAYRQLGFMAALPSEIVQQIFQYLNQRDCLVSMTVCRDWDAVVPQYSKSVWRELRLNFNDASRDYRRRERCLGDHVQSVILESTAEERESGLYIMMRKVLDWGCHGIESLGKVGNSYGCDTG